MFQGLDYDSNEIDVAYESDFLSVGLVTRSLPVVTEFC